MPFFTQVFNYKTFSDLSPGIKYKFQLKAEDSFSGITVMSDYVIVCTNPPDPIQLVCSLNAETMMAEINWEIPQGNYGANLESQISKDVNNQRKYFFIENRSLTVSISREDCSYYTNRVNLRDLCRERNLLKK